jgi:hypothetical protein
VPLITTHSFRPARDVRSPRARACVAFAGGVLALIALTGCTPEAGTPAATPTGSATPGATGEPTPAESATPTPTPTPTPAGTPVALECDQLLTPDEVYAFNPNFGSTDDHKPSKGSAAATAEANDGLACAWLNQTSGEIIEVSVAQPNEVLMTQLMDAAIAQSNPVPTYGTPPAAEGFFTNEDGPGEAQVFTPKYWVALTSTVFFEPGDAEQLVATVVSHLP